MPEDFDDIYYGEKRLYLVGWVGYRDVLDNYRHTSFCRLWDREQSRFVIVDDPDYERED